MIFEQGHLYSTRMELYPLLVHYQNAQISASIQNQRGNICYRTFSAIVDDVEGLWLVREWREREKRYKSNITSQILEATDYQKVVFILKEAEEPITEKDQDMSLEKWKNISISIKSVQTSGGSGFGTMP